MSARLTSDDIQPVMDLLDLLRDVRTALADLANGDWKAGDTGNVDFSDKQLRAVAFVRGLPIPVIEAGLKAMEKEVLSLLQAREIEVVELA